MEREDLLGAAYLGEDRCRFYVWAPLHQKVEVHLVSPPERFISLNAEGGYHSGIVEKVGPGSLYFYRLDGQKERPDPASRYQPDGVHGPSQVVDPYFPWEDSGWLGLPLQDHIIYELHVGTFTAEGHFEAIVPYLDELRGLGITALELMPVAQFPGNRNWGYDGAYPFAVQNSYGGPRGLKKLVNACHQRGLSVILDVVYNHLGPEGNYLRDFGPYFTDRYKTPWGEAINFDGPCSDEVRRYFIENALYWITELHIDGLRLDAIHGIFDFSARHILDELREAVQRQAKKLGRHIVLTAESNLNDVQIINSPERGGYGLDAQWNDDFHHSLHTLLTRERNGYYQDFGDLVQLAKALQEGFVYSGQYSLFRNRRHGSSSSHLPPPKFIVFSQNHDQVGNRMKGERLSALLSFEALKLAAGVVLLSPNIPLLFMGEEYGEEAPFQYFISHSDPALIETVRKGRKAEFSSFHWEGEAPDPQEEATFLGSKIHLGLRQQGPHKILLEYYKALISLRKEIPALSHPSKGGLKVKTLAEKLSLFLERRYEDDRVCSLFNFCEKPQEINIAVEQGVWQKVFDSSDTEWGGPGSSALESIQSNGREFCFSMGGYSFVLYRGKKAEE